MMKSSLAKAKSKETEEEETVDREQAEKTLLHAMSVMDDKHKLTLSPQQVMTVVQNCAESCRLTEHEVRGLLGEMAVDENGEIAYIDFVKTWTPIVFEVRASPSWSPFVGDLDELGIPKANLEALGRSFPVVPRVPGQEGGQRLSKRLSLRRSSKRVSQVNVGGVVVGQVGGALQIP